MQDTDFNPDTYKEAQRNDWNSVSSGWEKWWEVIEQGAAEVSVRMLEMAEIQPDHQVLDVATGIGEPAISAAQRVGSQGRVTAIDQATGMLDIARRRAQSHGLDNISFHEMDGEVIATHSDHFDAVLCRWGLMFMPNIDKALDGMYRALKPGGRISAVVWSYPDKVPSISLPIGVVRDILQLPPPPPDTPSPFSLADTVELQLLFENAGFNDVRFDSMMVDFHIPTVETYTEFTRDINAPLMALLADQPVEQQELIWESIMQALHPHVDPEGNLQLQNEAICITGRK